MNEIMEIPKTDDFEIVDTTSTPEIIPDGSRRKRRSSQTVPHPTPKRRLDTQKQPDITNALDRNLRPSSNCSVALGNNKLTTAPPHRPPPLLVLSESSRVKKEFQSDEIKRDDFASISQMILFMNQTCSDPKWEDPQTTNISDCDPKVIDEAQQLYALLHAQKVRVERVEVLSSQIRAGERGLGSLTRQLYETQLAIQRRELEISRLKVLYDEEKRSEENCNAAIRQLRRV